MSSIFQQLARPVIIQLWLFFVSVFLHIKKKNSEIKKQKTSWNMKIKAWFPCTRKTLELYLHSTFISRAHWGLKVSVYIKRLLRLLTVFQYCSWCIFVFLSKEELWYQTVCSRLQHLSKSKQGLSSEFAFRTRYRTVCILARTHSHQALVFSAFFRSIAITGPLWQNRMIDSNTKNTLEYPSSLHTTDFTVEL